MTPFSDDDPMLPTHLVPIRPSQDASGDIVAWCVAGVMVCLVGAMVMQLVAG